MIRNILLLFHRYTGLGIAVFLIITGLTGSLLVWQEELESWLSPELFLTSMGEPKSPEALLEDVQAQADGADVSFMMYPRETGKSLFAFVTNFPVEAGAREINQIFLDPVSGKLLGGRNSLDPQFRRVEFVRWLYKLHYSLTMGTMSSVGGLILGIVALVWFIDCFVGFYLTLPRNGFRWQKWTSAWRIKSTRFNFDFHRAAGLWLWPVLGILAFTSVYLNLSSQVFLPILKVFTTVSPHPYQAPALPEPLMNPALNWDQAVARAEREMDDQKIAERKLRYVGYYPSHGYYLVGYRTEHSLANTSVGVQIYISGADRSIIKTRIVGKGTAGDTLTEWQFPLHTGRAFGMVGRLVIFLSGLLITALSITGIVIWWRKRKARGGQHIGMLEGSELTATFADLDP